MGRCCKVVQVDVQNYGVHLTKNQGDNTIIEGINIIKIFFLTKTIMGKDSERILQVRCKGMWDTCDLFLSHFGG